MNLIDDLLRKVAAFKQCEHDQAHDWCTQLKRMTLFRDIPETTMAEICARMEAVAVQEGETLIREGDEGDFYYVVVEGRAAVTRNAGQEGEPDAWEKRRARQQAGTIKIAELGVGSGFGEEALISNECRNATVTMLEGGTVMRLARRDFEELLKEPQLNWFTPSQAAREVSKGAKWLDVRSRDARCLEGSLPGAIRAPIEDIRTTAVKLDKDTLYICYCRNARLSATAAFILTQTGFRVGVLQGGLRGLC
jgi:CRP-like cAMP-binding protein